MAKNYIQKGTTAEFVATAGVVSGQVVVLGGLLGVANADVLTGETGVAMIEGVFELPKVAGVAMNQGAFVTFDASTGQVIAEGGAGVAYVMADAAEADEVVLVKINAGAGAGGSGGLTPVPVAGAEVTVGATGDFATLSEAIQSVSETYTPAANSGQMSIRILTGTVLAEQVEFYNGSDLSWIRIISDDAIVPVNFASLTKAHPNTFFGTFYPLIGVASGSKSPNFKVMFEPSTAVTDYAKIGVMVTDAGSVLNMSASYAERFGVGFVQHGLKDFPSYAIFTMYGGHVNGHYLSVTGSGNQSAIATEFMMSASADLTGAVLDANLGRGLSVDDNSVVVAPKLSCQGNSSGARVLGGSKLYAQSGRFRQDLVTPADAATDLTITEGSIVHRSGPSTNGGCSIATPNAISAAGIYFN